MSEAELRGEAKPQGDVLLTRSHVLNTLNPRVEPCVTCAVRKQMCRVHPGRSRGK